MDPDTINPEPPNWIKDIQVFVATHLAPSRLFNYLSTSILGPQAWYSNLIWIMHNGSTNNRIKDPWTYLSNSHLYSTPEQVGRHVAEQERGEHRHDELHQHHNDRVQLKIIQYWF